jgi:uncharacterized membrane protein
MTLSILTLGGWLMFLRWVHYMAGVTWIGLLYYFNFVQGAFMAETDAHAKSQVLQKLLPRAMWWFRWGAMLTFISGALILASVGQAGGAAIMHSSWWVAIATGASLGTLMFLNVWLVIWPKQKIVIQNAIDVAAGKPANPDIATYSARALIASRTNTLFSIPMLFFMGAASHLGFQIGAAANLCTTSIIIGAILLLLELNCIKGKKLGPLTSIKGVIHCGLALAVVLYLIIEFTVK